MRSLLVLLICLLVSQLAVAGLERAGGSFIQRSALGIAVAGLLALPVNHQGMVAEQKPTVKLIAPGFIVPMWKLRGRIAQLKSDGFEVSTSFPATRSLENRQRALNEALLDPDCENLVCARGGYGTSDLLPDIPYDQLETHKRIIGYSDISSLLSALWTQKGFIGLSGPMPGAVTWHRGSEEMRILLGVMDGTVKNGQIPVQQLSGNDQTIIDGTLYGGDMSVLTNLIATPYMPESLAGYIVFFEALKENPYRLIRYLNQWQQSGVLDGVQAIVLGRFDGLGGNLDYLHKQVVARVDCPVFITEAFGHRRPLYPLPVGGQGEIEGGTLSWHIP